MIETIIVLGVSAAVVAMFVHASNKSVKKEYDKYIEEINHSNDLSENALKNKINRLQTDIDTLVSETSSDSDKQLIRKHYLNKINMREINFKVIS